MKSTKFSLKAGDFLRGTLIAFGTAFLTTLTQSLTTGQMPTGDQLRISAIAGVSAIIIYLTKNFFTNDVAAAQQTLVEARKKEAEEVTK